MEIETPCKNVTMYLFSPLCIGYGYACGQSTRHCSRVGFDTLQLHFPKEFQGQNSMPIMFPRSILYSFHQGFSPHHSPPLSFLPSKRVTHIISGISDLGYRTTPSSNFSFSPLCQCYHHCVNVIKHTLATYPNYFVSFVM